MPHGLDKRSCNVRWVSASEPFTLSPVQLRGSSLHAGVLAAPASVVRGFTASLGEWERPGDPQGKQVFLELDGGQHVGGL